MKLILPLLIILISLHFKAFSQDEEMLDKIVLSSCDCIEETDISGLNANQRNMKLGLCMLEASEPYADKLKREYDIDFDNMNGPEGEKLGKLLGLRLATQCPAFLKFVEDEYETEESNTVYELVGTIKDVSANQFYTVNIEDDEGREYKLLWMEHFIGGDKLTQKDWWKNRRVFITYEEKEFFEPKLNEYIKYKVIRGMESE